MRRPVLAGLVLLSALAGEARAQPTNDDDPTRPAPVWPANSWWKSSKGGRNGFCGSFDIGYGLVGGAVDTQDMFSGNARLGWLWRERLGMALEMTISTPPTGTRTFVLADLQVVAQYWLAPRLWLMGGGGIGGIDSKSDASSTDEPGVAFSASVGYEILHFEKLAIDARVRVGALAQSSESAFHAAGLIGLSFYGAE